MATHSYLPRPPRRLAAALALLIPLLAACGGAAPAAAPTAPAAASGGLAAVPTAAPAAPAATAAPAADSGAAPLAAPAAAEPTAAPAASGELAAPPAATAPPAAAGVAKQPTAPPAVAERQQQYAPLKAGEIDDNAAFNDYLTYLNTAGGIRAHTLDVSERYILTVVNDSQEPVLDARVQIFDRQQLLFEGRTYAGGKTVFFPRGVAMPAGDAPLRVEVTKGNSRAEAQLVRGQSRAQTIALKGARALPDKPRLDVLFLLDATGSMGDEIAQIQQTIVSIAERIDQIQPRPELRFALVSYRDRGDDYVTRVNDFTPDVGQFRDLLMSTAAGGGGDDPESMNEALHAAVERVSWADDAVRLTFLVADAPPHLDYAQDYDYVQESRAAVARGIKIYTIAASNTGDEAEYVMRQIAQQTLARFIFLTYQAGQNSGAPGDTTVHTVDPDAFTVERLDDLVVQVVERELALAQGVA